MPFAELTITGPHHPCPVTAHPKSTAKKPNDGILKDISGCCLKKNRQNPSPHHSHGYRRVLSIFFGPTGKPVVR
jgi:hypothetical protein